MKTLTQVWELIQLLSSLRLLSPTLVRANNPQTYTFHCVYDPDCWKGIVECKDSSCSYYRRIVKSKRLEVAGVVASGGAGMGTTVGGVKLTVEGTDGVWEGIKNELKWKWESEQKDVKINDLQRLKQEKMVE